MPNIGFFTALKFDPNMRSYSQAFIEKVDDYFYLGGKKAHVIQAKLRFGGVVEERTRHGIPKAVLCDVSSSCLLRVAKAISYLTVLIPFILLLTKTAWRLTHAYHVIDPKEQLKKGIYISSEIKEKLSRLMPQIRTKAQDPEITWLTNRPGNLVFKLKSVPGIVFKIPPPGEMVIRGNRRISANVANEERYANMIKAKEICLVNQLGLLRIPRAKTFDVVSERNASVTFIAEEELDIEADEKRQEELHMSSSQKMDRTMHQLAIFVAKTGFHEVVLSNVPLVNEYRGLLGERRVALIDLEHMGTPSNSIAVRDGIYGLIQCATSRKQIEIIVEEARKQGVVFPQGQPDQILESQLRKLTRQGS